MARNGYIGQLQHIDVWCRDVSFNVDQYQGKPCGSSVEIPVPEDLDFDAWTGPSPLVPYTADRATAWGGYHCRAHGPSDPVGRGKRDDCR